MGSRQTSSETSLVMEDGRVVSGGDEAELGPYRKKGEQMHSCEHRTAYFVHLQNLDMLQRW